MNNGPVLFLGAFLALATSFWGMILAPQLQVGRQDLRAVEPSGRLYPSSPLGLAKEGEAVYRAHGCVECHSRQIRPAGFGGDIDRGWGIRRSVAQDYLRDDPVQLGNLRVGPDLANIGVRQPAADWHLKHLFNPRILVPKSTMPPYRFLFQTRWIDRNPSPDALDLEKPFAPGPGYEVVPTDEAKALVAYLISLQAKVPLFEAPLPPQPESESESREAPQAEADTNAVPAQTGAEPAGADTNLTTVTPTTP